MSHGRIDLRTEDGTCPAHVFSPETPGRWPGVLFFMDGIGIRPALFEMGERMASAGYHVLLPDLYYRTGYCLGGRLSFAAAGHFPDRVAAAASYHPSCLATEAPDSPHRLAPAMQARVYVAGAIEDAGFDDAQKQRLEDALTAAGVDHRIETYDARHGWVPSDTPAHDPAAAERHWRTLFDLFGGTIGRG